MKGKKLLNFCVLVFCAGIIAGCVGAYIHWQIERKEDDKKLAELEKKFDTTPIFSEETYPKVDGSTATLPLSLALKKDFTFNFDAEVEHSMTHEAYINLIDGNSDLILVVDPSEDEKAYAKEKNVELKFDKIANEGFVFFVNKDNPVDSLTLEQIQKIYTGEITNWKEVGGNDEEILAYQRPENSGSQTAMEDLVMKGKTLKEAEKEDIADSMFDIVDVVSNYNNGVNSIGYSYYYFANTMYLGENIKMLKINEVAPNNETIKSGKYPIMTGYYAVTRENDASKDTLKLIDAILSTRGQRIVEENGYVPIY